MAMKPGGAVLYATLPRQRAPLRAAGHPLSACPLLRIALAALLGMSGLPRRCRPRSACRCARRSLRRAAASASSSRASSGTKAGPPGAGGFSELRRPRRRRPRRRSDRRPGARHPLDAGDGSNSGRGGRCHDRAAAATALLAHLGHGPLPAPLRPLHAAQRRGQSAAQGILTFEEILYFVRVAEAQIDLSKIHVTGGEPLVRANVVGLVRCSRAREPGPGPHDSGQALPARRPPFGAPACAGSCQPAESRRENVRNADPRRALQQTLRGIARAQSVGLAPVKLNAVNLRGWNDGEVERLAAFAVESGCTMRFLGLMPIGCARPLAADRFVPAAEIRRRLEGAFALTPLACRARPHAAISSSKTAAASAGSSASSRPRPSRSASAARACA